MRLLALLFVVSVGVAVRRKPSYPPSCRATRSSFRATKAAIRSSAPSGGTSPAGWRLQSGEPLGFQITFFRNAARHRRRQSVALRRAAGAVRACRGQRSAARHAAARREVGARGLRSRRSRGGLARRARSTTGRCARTATRYLRRGVRRASSRWSCDCVGTQPPLLQRQERLQSEGSAAAVRELLLQPAATAGQRSHRDRRSRASRARRRVVRSRMVERACSTSRRGVGTGSASISTTAAR